MNRKPNVLIFFTDQQRWDTSSLHGNPLDLMPNFERMARRGAHFENSFTCQPVCGPARSCLQTGQYATETGVFTNMQALDEQADTIAKYFREAGYRTGYIGKWHLAGTRVSWHKDDQEPVPESRRGGYEEWLAADLLEFSSDAYDTSLFNENNERVKLPGYRVDALTDAAIRFIDRNQNDAFFLFLSFLEPHHQNTRDDYPAPPGYAERYRDAWTPPDLATLGGSTQKHLPGYYGMVKRLDECLGRVTEAIESLGLADDTVVLFTSDHGNHFKTRNSEYKRSPHDSSLRTPFAAQGPGFDGGGTVTELVSLVDLPPTLLDLAGIQQKTPMQGRSLLPLVRREATDWPDDVFAQISESQVGRVIRTRRWKYSVVAPGIDGCAQPAAEEYEEACLYDLYADPYELENLAGGIAFRAVADRLKERLLSRIKTIEGATPTIRDAPERVLPGQRVVMPEEANE